MSLHTQKNTQSGKATLSFYGDDDTGIHSSAANRVSVLAGGAALAVFGAGIPQFFSQGAPTAMTTTATVTSAALLTGIIAGTPSAGDAAYTLPTGALLDAAIPDDIGTGMAFEWVLINLSANAADTITVTAGTGHTIVGDPVVISTHVTTGGAITSRGVSSSRWLTRKTAADTFVTYRVE